MLLLTVNNIFIGKDGLLSRPSMISLSYLLTIGTHHVDDLLEVALHEVHDPVPGGGVKILHLPRLQRQVYIVLFVRLENRNIDFQCILAALSKTLKMGDNFTFTWIFPHFHHRKIR